MSELEGPLKQALEPLIIRQERVLSPHQLRRMRSHRAIPGGTRVWLGSCREHNPTVTSHTLRGDLTDVCTPDTPERAAEHGIKES